MIDYDTYITIGGFNYGLELHLDYPVTILGALVELLHNDYELSSIEEGGELVKGRHVDVYINNDQEMMIIIAYTSSNEVLGTETIESDLVIQTLRRAKIKHALRK